VGAGEIELQHIHAVVLAGLGQIDPLLLEKAHDAGDDGAVRKMFLEVEKLQQVVPQGPIRDLLDVLVGHGRPAAVIHVMHARRRVGDRQPVGVQGLEHHPAPAGLKGALHHLGTVGDRRGGQQKGVSETQSAEINTQGDVRRHGRPSYPFRYR
jgi:hypothetical protein